MAQNASKRFQRKFMFKYYFTVTFSNLLRHKMFLVTNILVLSVSLAACFLIYTYSSFERSYDDFNTKASRIYRVVTDTKTPSQTIKQGLTSANVAIYMKKDFPEVEDAVRLSRDGFLVQKGNQKFHEKNVLLADSTLFNVFDFSLIKGNKNTALGEPMSIILSQTAAKKYFGHSDPLGQQILLTGKAIRATVTGLMKDIPENSQIQADIFVSLSSGSQIFGMPADKNGWINHNYYTYLLLKPQTDPKALEKKFPVFVERRQGPEARQLWVQDYLSLEPLLDVYLKSTRDGFAHGNINDLYTFSAIAIFILLIGCINFINLNIARCAVRTKEAVNGKEVETPRFQLVRQWVAESIIVCLIAFLLSLVISSFALPLLNQLAGKQISTGIFKNPLPIAGLFLLAVDAGIIAGSYPALVLFSNKAIRLLKACLATGTGSLLLRKGLIVFQSALSISLIVAIVIVHRQLAYGYGRDLGFCKEQTLAIKPDYDKIKNYSNHRRGGNKPGAALDWNDRLDMVERQFKLAFLSIKYISC
jgi:putative ABC transport system permease protein